MGWLAVAIVVVFVAVAAWIGLYASRATIYFSHAYGYRAITLNPGDEERLKPVSRERYETILVRFLQGDRFDQFWVSLNQDSQSGLVLSLEGEEIELSISFHSLKETERVTTFREKMAAAGYIPVLERPWNIGLGEDLESVSFEYRLVQDLNQVRKAIDLGLSFLEGEADGTMFVHAWRSQDGPGRWPITIRFSRDVLADV